MKKYRCPKCGEFFEGESATCPHCGALMKYRQTVTIEEEIQKEVASVGPKFNFHGSDVVFHPDSIFDEEQYENVGAGAEENKKEEEIIKAPEHFEKMVMEEGKSFYDGKASAKFGYGLMQLILTLGTAFLAYPWIMCMKYRYEAKHTVINGRRLCFDGKGSQLFGRFLLWFVLTILTVFLFFPTLSSNLKKWKAMHTHFLTSSGEKV